MLRTRALFALAITGIVLVFLFRQHKGFFPMLHEVSYTDREVGFTVHLPRGWLVRERPNVLRQPSGVLGVDPVLVVTERVQGAEAEFNSNIIVSVREVPEIPSAADPQKVAGLASEVLESVVVPKGSGATRTFESNGLSGAQSNIQYIQELQGKRIKLTASVAALVSAHHRRCFLITATAPTKDFEQYQPVFKNFIRSLRET